MKDQADRLREMAEALYAVYQTSALSHYCPPWDQVTAEVHLVWLHVAEEAFHVVTDQFKEALATNPDTNKQAMLALLLQGRTR